MLGGEQNRRSPGKSDMKARRIVRAIGAAVVAVVVLAGSATTAGATTPAQVNAGVAPNTAVAMIARLVDGQWQLHCSGFFISGNRVATAGHCITDHKKPGNAYIQPTELRVWSGYDWTYNRTKPPCPLVDDHNVSWTHANPRWVGHDPSLARGEDWGMIALVQPCTSGPYFGFIAGSGWVADQRIPWSSQGYPAELMQPGQGPLNGSKQYKITGRITAVGPTQVSVNFRTMGGMSGGPIWTYMQPGANPQCAGYCATAINTWGEGVPSYGSLINQEVYDHLAWWRWVQTPPAGACRAGWSC